MSNDSAIQNGETDLRSKIDRAGTACMDKASEVAGSIIEKSKEAASAVAHTLGDAVTAAGTRANQATAAVGTGMKSFAGAIRDNLDGDSSLGPASSSIAETLESGGRYLEEQGLGGMARDTTNLIRRYPIPALLVGIGVGFLLAKVTTRSMNHG